MTYHTFYVCNGYRKGVSWYIQLIQGSWSRLFENPSSGAETFRMIVDVAGRMNSQGSTYAFNRMYTIRFSGSGILERNFLKMEFFFSENRHLKRSNSVIERWELHKEKPGYQNPGNKSGGWCNKTNIKIKVLARPARFLGLRFGPHTLLGLFSSTFPQEYHSLNDQTLNLFFSPSSSCFLFTFLFRFALMNLPVTWRHRLEPLQACPVRADVQAVPRWKKHEGFTRCPGVLSSNRGDGACDSAHLGAPRIHPWGWHHQGPALCQNIHPKRI